VLEDLPPVLTPPLVDRSLGIPPANIPPNPGAAPIVGGGGGGAELCASALPTLLALVLALAFVAGGRNPAPPAPGIGGAAPRGGPELLLVTLADL